MSRIAKGAKPRHVSLSIPAEEFAAISQAGYDDGLMVLVAALGTGLVELRTPHARRLVAEHLYRVVCDLVVSLPSSERRSLSDHNLALAASLSESEREAQSADHASWFASLPASARQRLAKIQKPKSSYERAREIRVRDEAAAAQKSA